MTIEEQNERAEQQRSAQAAGSLGVPIALLMMSLICGAASLALVVFGVWPGVILVLACAGLLAYAVRRFKRYDLATKG